MTAWVYSVVVAFVLVLALSIEAKSIVDTEQISAQVSAELQKIQPELQLQLRGLVEQAGALKGVPLEALKSFAAQRRSLANTQFQNRDLLDPVVSLVQGIVTEVLNLLSGLLGGLKGLIVPIVNTLVTNTVTSALDQIFANLEDTILSAVLNLVDSIINTIIPG